MLVAGATAAGWVGAKTSANSNWIADTMTAIKNSQNSAGILGALQNSGDGSIDSFLSQNAANSNNLAQISQNNLTSASSFYAQLAAQNLKARNDKVVQKALEALTQSQQMVQPKNVLDPVIYFPDGATLDTNANILTESDGTQYDALTGALYVDPKYIIQMANGSYLDTKNNILTMPDGTRIDTVTGLKISTTA